MHTEFKRLINHSIVYFAGSTLNKLGVFLLLPIYTQYLTPGEYGVLELVLVTVAIMRIFLGIGFSHSTLRFFFEYKEEKERKRLVSTSLLSVTLWCFFLTLLLMFFSNDISVFVFKSDSFRLLLILGFSVMFFEVINEIPFAVFRAKELSFLYILSSLAQLIIRVGLNIYIVIYLRKGVQGILVGNLISAAVIWLILCIFVFKYSGIAFDFSKLKSLWKYSYPLIIASFPSLVAGNMDRIFLHWYGSLEIVGVYALAIRFGMALQGFVLEPFQLGYSPFRFSIMKQENAKDIYARILTYFVFIVTFIGLIIIIFSREIIELMSSELFKDAYKIVPFAVFATILKGVSYIVQTGLLIEKKTIYTAYIATITFVLNILALFLLVPLLGMYGAGFSMLLVSLLDSLLNYLFSQKHYRIRFEYQRLTKIAGVALLIYFLSIFINESMEFSVRLFLKTGVILIFPFLLMRLNFYTKEEIAKLFILKEKISTKVFALIGSDRR
ncbi:MAG: oligosaccharide flippase family protein [Nitrospirota bacterium]